MASTRRCRTRDRVVPGRRRMHKSQELLWPSCKTFDCAYVQRPRGTRSRALPAVDGPLDWVNVIVVCLCGSGALFSSVQAGSWLQSSSFHLGLHAPLFKRCTKFEGRVCLLLKPMLGTGKAEIGAPLDYRYRNSNCAHSQALTLDKISLVRRSPGAPLPRTPRPTTLTVAEQVLPPCCQHPIEHQIGARPASCPHLRPSRPQRPAPRPHALQAQLQRPAQSTVDACARCHAHLCMCTIKYA